MANQSIPANLLSQIQKHFSRFKTNPKVYKELRERLNKLSVFADRNPLVSSVANIVSLSYGVCTGGSGYESRGSFN